MNTRNPFRPNRRIFLGASALGAASLLLSPCGRAGAQAPAILKLPKKITLKIATITAETFPYVDGLKFWKKAIETRTAVPMPSPIRFFV